MHNSSDYEGTGIGLALCKKIVEDHKGYISVKSVEGKGSTFIVSLPVEPGDYNKEESVSTQLKGAIDA